MNSRELISRNWRIPVVALLAAVLAFAASYVVSPSYTSSTRLLVHGRDATFLTSTGQDLAAQPGVVDASLSQALLSTYAGIATSRTPAVAVVEKLKLDKTPVSFGPLAFMAQAAAWAYRCGRAFVTFGFCAPVDRYEKAVLEVQEGTTAAPVGTNEGAAAGQQGSYVLELRSSGHTPVQARDITNSLADELVQLSTQRFKRDADNNVASLQAQVDQAQADLRKRTQAIAAYETKHGISTADAKQALTAATYENVRADLIKAKADLADTEAQINSVGLSLAQIPREERQKQTIVTGRSTTETNTDSANSVYSDLQTKLTTLQAEHAGDVARVSKLQGQIDHGKPVANNGPLAELALLQQQADLVRDNVSTLTATLQKAQTTAAQGSVDLSRLDDASQPTYPAKPKRYIYLALGLLIGALVGAVLNVRAHRRIVLEEARVMIESVEDLDPDDAAVAGDERPEAAKVPTNGHTWSPW